MEDTHSKVLREFRVKKRLTASGLSQKLRITRQAVHRHLTTLVRQGSILKLGTSRKTTFYLKNDPEVLKEILGTQRSFKKRYRIRGLDEEFVFQEVDRQPYLLTSLSSNARTLFHYALTEMLNNAIDHSLSRFVDLEAGSNLQSTFFSVIDHGVGIFENIRTKKGLGSELEALQDLLKGKQTTDPSRHSGGGIFFTSKAAGHLVIESHKKKLTIDNPLNDIFVSDVQNRSGTRVSFELDNRAQRKIEDIFREFTNENFQFQKSLVMVKLFGGGEEYVSRSQAKRLLHAMDRFSEITLDFRDIKTIGQGFADEIFRVFLSQHPGIKIIPINCHENVRFMIDRAKTSEGANTS